MCAAGRKLSWEQKLSSLCDDHSSSAVHQQRIHQEQSPSPPLQHQHGVAKGSPLGVGAGRGAGAGLLDGDVCSPRSLDSQLADDE